jgi:hypothetical protein
MMHFFSLIQSVVAAAFGVQSESKRKQDFQQASPIHLIIAGIMFLVIFISLVLLTVSLAIPSLQS